MKRFTETNKWSDPWFRKLSSAAKQLWGYLCDHCDLVGVVEIDLQLASQDCGQPITETHLKELGDRIEPVSESKYLIPRFINFQYGELSTSCPPHRNIIKQVHSHGLVRVGLLYRYPKATLLSQVVENQQNPYPNARVALPYKTRQEEEKEKDQDKDRGSLRGNSINGEPRPAGPGGLASFDLFWNAYPKQVKRTDAEHAFVECGAHMAIEDVVSALEIQKRSQAWKKDNGRYIPDPGNWLRNQQWLDVTPEMIQRRKDIERINKI